MPSDWKTSLAGGIVAVAGSAIAFTPDKYRWIPTLVLAFATGAGFKAAKDAK